MTYQFTSWQDLYNEILNKLTEFITTGRFQMISYGISGRTITFRTIEDMQRGLEWIKVMADIEQGRAVGRTYAKPKGRFNG